MKPKPYVIDVVDVSDMAGRYWVDCLDGHNTVTIPIGGMSNALQKMIDLVIAQTGNRPVIRCLALWGHGLVKADHSPIGIHLIAGGGAAATQRSALTNATILSLGQNFDVLKDCFHSEGRVELRGCGVAGTIEGLEVMKMIAFRWGVPVQAAEKNQPTMSWLPPVREVSPMGHVGSTPGIDYNLRD
jgi:hypothetical protein